MIEQLIARVFYTRNLVHDEHLRTTSWARHEALGELYDALISAVDDISETWQGAFDDLPPLPSVDAVSGDLVEHLVDESDWIEVNREEIANGHNAIMSLIDILNCAYLKAIYKLKRFI